MKARFAATILLTLMLAATARAAGAPPSAPGAERPQDPFDALAGNALSYFVPMTGKIIAIGEGIVFSDLGGKDGLIRPMRLDILREGEPFYHPITKEPLGRLEDHAGRAEVVEVFEDKSMLRVIDGDAKTGDVLRVSSGRVRALFYQTSDVDWNLAEEYYYRLKETERFDLMDSAPGLGDEGEILEEARALNAEVAIVLSAAGPSAMTVLRQRLLWVEDGSELSSMEVTLAEDTVRRYRLGEEFFTPEKNQPTITFTIPYSTRLINAADMDGDGVDEIVISTGSTVRFYSFGASLRPALDAAEIKGKFSEENIWLDAADIDHDGRDELLLTSVSLGRPVSRIYKYEKGGFRTIWTGELFARLISGELYAQRHAIGGGYKGPVFKIRPDEAETGPDEGQEAAPEALTLPGGINIFDFTLVTTPGGSMAALAFDGRGHLNLLGPDGGILWRSAESYGGAIKEMEKEAPTEMTTAEKWYVSDRIIGLGSSAITVRRHPFAQTAKGIGFKKAQIMDLNWTESEVSEAVSVDEIPGSVLDFAVSENRLFVLISSLGIEPANILQGRGIFTSKLFIYTLQGI